MATRNIVPREDAEGSLGTKTKRWGSVAAKQVTSETGNITTLTSETGNITTLTVERINGSNQRATPGLYAPDTHFYSTEQIKILSPLLCKININNNEYMISTQQTLAVSTDASWDSKATPRQADKDYKINDIVYPTDAKNGYYYRCTTAGKTSTLAPTWPITLGETYNDGSVIWTCELDYTVAANRAGKDFYIYACIPGTGTEPILLLSTNSTVPAGYTADNSRKVGGFHCLCADIGTIAGHPLSGYVTGDILPASVWDLSHRPKSDPEGMAYIDGIDLWVDIYLASWTGAYSNTPEDLKLVSRYNAVCADGTSLEKFHCFKFEQVFGRQKKRLLYQREFVCASIGSNQSTNVAGSADINTTGGFKDTAGRRMISNFGLEDCCGNLWQWGADVGSATTGTSSYGNAYTADDKYVAGQEYGSVYRPLLGGCATLGVVCGSRASYWTYGALYLDWSLGARGASEPLHGNVN